jgi:chloramphenicol O-acetyltransferase
MGSKKMKRKGDRKDATLIRDNDPLHSFMPYLLLGRADNEAVLNDDMDLTAVNQYLEEKNASNPDFKYTIFHVVMAAIAKTIYLRPAMNRFMQGHRLYQRNDISFSFVVKRAFSDKAEEALVIMKIDPESDVSPIEQIYSHVKKEVNYVRKENHQDSTTQTVGILTKIPRPFLRMVAKILFWLEYHGWLPDLLSNIDPYHTTCFLSNLGSIKMTASYHHLVDWGTNSFFVVIGEKHFKPIFEADGTYQMREVLPLSFTIDERIADGFYFANSIKVLRKILQNPQILDQPLKNDLED